MNPLRFIFQLFRQCLVTLAIKARNVFFALKVVLRVKNWKEYFYDIYDKNKKRKIIYELSNGTKYVTRSKTKDRDIFVEIVLGNEYFTDQIKLNKTSVVFDIGAQIGIFSVFIAGKARKIFSFEPVPENFELLEENIKLNGLEEKVKTFNLAVSSKKGKEKIFLNSNNSGGHSIFGKGSFIEVNSVDLKEIFEENRIEECDLLKIDVEGAEYNILYALPEKFFQRIKQIVMECHEIDLKQKNFHSMIVFLESKGFKVKYRKSLYNFPVLFAFKAFN
ncbi:FkbM family methyltransferase [Candidatus Micrarchaeota archaeon]|nr:FkbM family methyltransferase [Candidatus Micrarchaeota archaeon]MBU2477324.1 FkbM family methyltransferase [Candidatus Micrarchaeota archaeon]